MKCMKNVTMIEGHLGFLLEGYIQEFRSNGNGFEEFSDEAILYGLLEYSKFPRDYTKEKRIEYVHGKCLEYEGKRHVYVKVEFDDQYGCFVVLYPEKSSNSPF